MLCDLVLTKGLAFARFTQYLYELCTIEFPFLHVYFGHNRVISILTYNCKCFALDPVEDAMCSLVGLHQEGIGGITRKA
jgi:hypothetical protein